MAAIAVYFTLNGESGRPDLLRRRAIVHWIDNFAALAALVHGYASKPDLARLVNIFHAQIAGLCNMFWGDLVPSAANPGDIPTRMARHNERKA